ncbi:GntR family transcriptional regulator [Roseovarius sp. ZX-A-9]|uniref:GntR family transcriptional regulator n=1 Tax=Roseovarius sp. ZX-A-9 TaxID=3014783 RepID=UPI00232D141C|nr:GntR family transcriptional regulator [Roseovarius sp. ZX-A-9]
MIAQEPNKQQNINQEEPDFSFETKPLSSQVETYLVRELMRGHLIGGQRINEAEMARNLGISRNPIREAVRRLEERGVLVSLPRRGTFVRTFSRKDVDDIFSFRLVVEDFSLRQGLSKMTDAQLEEIVGTVREMEAAAERDDAIALVEKDFEFHHLICKLPNNHQSLHAFLTIQAELQLLITMIDRKFETLEAAAVDHWPVVDALRTRNLAAVRKALREHIKDSWSRLSDNYDGMEDIDTN